MNGDTDLRLAWDGRQLFTRRMDLLMGKVSDSNMNNLKEWLENLYDLYDFTSCVVGNDLEAELEDIEKVIYNPGSTKIDKAQVIKRMRKVTRTINKRLWDMGLWIPEKEQIDVVGDMFDDVSKEDLHKLLDDAIKKLR